MNLKKINLELMFWFYEEKKNVISHSFIKLVFETMKDYSLSFDYKSIFI